MRGWGALCLLGAALTASLALSRPVAAAQPESAIREVDARALKLAALVVPSIDFQIQVAKATFDAAASADKDSAEIYQQYPSLLSAVWKEIEPDFRTWLIALQPGYEEGLARVYMAHLTAAQIEILHRFYLTPTGRKTIAQMRTVATVSPVIEEVLDSPEGEISRRSLDAAGRKLQRQLMSDLTEQDAYAFAELGRMIPAAKANSLKAAIQAFELEWSNRPDPEFEGRIGKKVEAFVIRYINAQGSV